MNKKKNTTVLSGEEEIEGAGTPAEDVESLSSSAEGTDAPALQGTVVSSRRSRATTNCDCPRCRIRRQKKAAQAKKRTPRRVVEATAIVEPLSEEERLSEAEKSSPPSSPPPEPQKAAAPEESDPLASHTTNAAWFGDTTAQPSPRPTAPPHQKRRPTATGKRKRSRRNRSFQLVAAAVFLVIICFAVLVGELISSRQAPAATVAIVPLTEAQNETMRIAAVTNRPGPGEVAAQLFTATSPVRQVSAHATGEGQTPATTSHGTLLLYNELSSPVTIKAPVTITSADGIQVVISDTVTVPAGSPPNTGMRVVNAQSIQTGHQANIKEGDISGLCCAPGIAVRNNPFSGGQDAQPYPILTQGDVNAAAENVSAGLIQQAQTGLKKQFPPTQAQAGQPQCKVSASSGAPVGSHVGQATISVSATCTGETYDQSGALRLAASLFRAAVNKRIGATYTPVSQITTRIVQIDFPGTERGTLSISIQARGTWIYQFSADRKHIIALHIQGKPIEEGRRILSQEPGVAHSSIAVTGNTPRIPDLDHITIVVTPASSTS